MKLPDLSRLRDLSASDRKKIALVGGGLLLLLILVFIVVRLVKPGHLPVTVANVAVTIQTEPPGASVKINGEDRGASNLQIELPAGTYQIEARLAGYKPAATSLELKAGSPGNISLTLEPGLPVVRLSSASGTGKASLDDEPLTDLEGGQWIREGIPLGEHRLKFSGVQGDLNLSFQSGLGEIVQPSRPVASKDVHAVVVGNSGGRLQIFCTFCPAKFSLDGQPEVDIGADGLELPSASLGTHSLALRQGGDQHTLEIDIGAVPTLSVFLASDLNVATLLIVTGEDKAQVFLNGQPYKRLTQSGQLLVSNLEPKKYDVRVVKEGFQASPEQSAVLKKGQQSRLTFNMQPLPRLAALSIQGGVPSTEVLVDQVVIGTLQPDGSFHSSSISPGDHVVELRKEGFNSKQLHEHFGAGATLSLGAAEAALEGAKGELKITFNPPDAVVTIARLGETPIKVVSENTLSLPPGSYVLVAKAAEYSETRSIQIVAGQAKTLTLQMVPGGMADWEMPAGWRADGGVFTRKGGGLVLYKTSPTTGMFVFSAMLRKGRRLEWVLSTQDDKNYLLFQMDDDFFYRGQVKDGQSIEAVKTPYHSDKKKFRTFQVRVSSGEVVTQILEGRDWKPLDHLVMRGIDLSAGKFGFLIPGNDEVSLSNFRHYAQPGARQQ
jgi:hypothetical protein